MTPKLNELLEKGLQRLRREHGNRLVFDESAALKQVELDKPSTVKEAYEQLVRLTAAALADYCDQVRSEVETFVDRTLPGLGEDDSDEILRAASKQFDGELYLQRFDMFEGTIERHFGRAGRQFNPKDVRLDLLRAAQQAGTATGISRFLASLRDDLELRVLANQQAIAVRLAPTETQDDSAKAVAHRELLLDLFRVAAPPRFGVDGRSFRVRHHTKIGVLDEMVRCDAIRDVQGFYSPTLLALSELRAAPDVQQLFADCDSVLHALRSRYLENQADLIACDDLAMSAELARDRFGRALAYLNESVSLLAGSQGGSDCPLQKVLPAEKVLLLKDVEDVLAELRRYRELRSTWAGLPLEAAGASPTSPAHEVIEEKPWLQHLPDDVRALLAETYAAQRSGLRALVLMGVRAAIDMTCNHLVGDLGRFDLKLDKLRSSGRITEKQQQALHAVIQLGHASAHRGHVPSADDVSDVLDILERMLKTQYVDPHTTVRLIKGTPPRQ